MLIGIGGCSRSGKTELSEALMWAYRQNDKRVFCIHQDNLVLKLSQIPQINGTTDWDTPYSIDFELLQRVISFYEQQFDVVIVEGIYAFHDPSITALYHHCLYVEISKETFLERRSHETRWGTEPQWYLEHVWQSHLKYGFPPKSVDLQHISGETPYDIDSIMVSLI